MRPDDEPAAVGEALRSPVLIRYQPRIAKAMCLLPDLPRPLPDVRRGPRCPRHLEGHSIAPQLLPCAVMVTTESVADNLQATLWAPRCLRPFRATSKRHAGPAICANRGQSRSAPQAKYSRCPKDVVG
jgi:hypothetical protein